MKLLLVGAGGFLGSVARYLLSGYVQTRASDVFPFGTLVVNVLGCFVIGALSEMAEARAFLSADARAFGHGRNSRRFHDVFGIRGTRR